MEDVADFSVLYKRLIDANLAPERGRAEAALDAILRSLTGGESSKKITVDSSEKP